MRSSNHDEPQLSEPIGATQLTRRTFFSVGAYLAGASALQVATGNAFSQLSTRQSASTAEGTTVPPFQLPPLSYSFDALEPFIDAQTMELRHDKHHATYVKNLNAALEGQDKFKGMPINELLRNLNKLPENVRTDVRNNGGGHANLSLFWKLLKKNNGAVPTGEFAERLNADFGSFERFKTAFQDAGTKLFGSGWIFVVMDPKNRGHLKIHSMPNQDSPFSQGMVPLLGNDVWEHAYYLKYQNRRADYLTAWWNVVDWEFIAKRYEAIRSGNEPEIANG